MLLIPAPTGLRLFPNSFSVHHTQDVALQETLQNIKTVHEKHISTTCDGLWKFWDNRSPGLVL